MSTKVKETRDWGRRLHSEDAKERVGAIKEISSAFKGGATMETAAARLGMSPRNLYRLLDDKELKAAVHTVCPAGTERKGTSYQKSSLWLRFQNPQTHRLVVAEVKRARESSPNARTAAAKLKVSERTYFRMCAVIDGKTEDPGAPHSELWLKLHGEETREAAVTKIQALLEKHTVADVAEKLGVSPRTLYRLFEEFPQIRSESAA
jgi:AraC-like DNA-binding protein